MSDYIKFPIQYIPEKKFKIARYYNLYIRKRKINLDLIYWIYSTILALTISNLMNFFTLSSFIHRPFHHAHFWRTFFIQGFSKSRTYYLLQLKVPYE